MISGARASTSMVGPADPESLLLDEEPDEHRSEAPHGIELTTREQRVLVELAGGRSTEEVAAALWLSPHTIRSHVKSASRKLGAKTRAQAVALAIKQGAIRVQAESTRPAR